MYLRRNVEPARLEDAVAILVTQIKLFSTVAFQFGRTHSGTKEVTSVITRL